MLKFSRLQKWPKLSNLKPSPKFLLLIRKTGCIICSPWQDFFKNSRQQIVLLFVVHMDFRSSLLSLLHKQLYINMANFPKAVEGCWGRGLLDDVKWKN